MHAGRLFIQCYICFSKIENLLLYVVKTRKNHITPKQLKWWTPFKWGAFWKKRIFFYFGHLYHSSLGNFLLSGLFGLVTVWHVGTCWKSRDMSSGSLVWIGVNWKKFLLRKAMQPKPWIFILYWWNWQTSMTMAVLSHIYGLGPNRFWILTWSPSFNGVRRFGCWAMSFRSMHVAIEESLLSVVHGVQPERIEFGIELSNKME